MPTATLNILVKWLILPKPIDITVRTPESIVKYHIKQIESLEPIHLYKAVIGLKKEILFIKEKKKKLLEVFNENIKKEFLDRNPCCLLTIENINLPEEHNTNTIPNFLQTRIYELTYALALLYSCPIKPLFYIYQVEGIKEIRFYSFVDGVNKKGYDEYFKERNMKELTERYLPSLMINQRADEKLILSLILYKIALEMTADKLRIIFFWTILEVLAGNIEVNNVYKFISKYFSVDIEALKGYYDTRCKLVHSGLLKGDYDYSEANKELQKLIQEVIFSVYGNNGAK